MSTAAARNVETLKKGETKMSGTDYRTMKLKILHIELNKKSNNAARHCKASNGGENEGSETDN